MAEFAKVVYKYKLRDSDLPWFLRHVVLRYCDNIFIIVSIAYFASFFSMQYARRGTFIHISPVKQNDYSTCFTLAGVTFPIHYKCSPSQTIKDNIQKMNAKKKRHIPGHINVYGSICRVKYV